MCSSDLSKPFGMMELIARVRAVLRRADKTVSKKEYQIGPLFLCPERHEILLNGEQLSLTYKEFSLLCLLAENRGIVLTRTMLMDRVWGLEANHENRTLDVHIRTLRAKMKEAGRYIETVRGIGYRLMEEINDS